MDVQLLGACSLYGVEESEGPNRWIFMQQPAARISNFSKFQWILYYPLSLVNPWMKSVPSPLDNKREVVILKFTLLSAPRSYMLERQWQDNKMGQVSFRLIPLQWEGWSGTLPESVCPIWCRWCFKMILVINMHTASNFNHWMAILTSVIHECGIRTPSVAKGHSRRPLC